MVGPDARDGTDPPPDEPDAERRRRHLSPAGGTATDVPVATGGRWSRGCACRQRTGEAAWSPRPASQSVRLKSSVAAVIATAENTTR